MGCCSVRRDGYRGTRHDPRASAVGSARGPRVSQKAPRLCREHEPAHVDDHEHDKHREDKLRPGRANFAVLDCGEPLPFKDGDFVLCIDVISHLRDRFGTLREWARLLRPGERLVFTDSAVITGAIAKSDAGDTDAAFNLLGSVIPPGA